MQFNDWKRFYQRITKVLGRGIPSKQTNKKGSGGDFIENHIEGKSSRNKTLEDTYRRNKSKSVISNKKIDLKNLLFGIHTMMGLTSNVYNAYGCHENIYYSCIMKKDCIHLNGLFIGAGNEVCFICLYGDCLGWCGCHGVV